MQYLRVITTLLFAFTIAFIPTRLRAQGDLWQQTNGPFGGIIHALICTNNGVIIAGTDVGAFRSTDQGYSWRQDGTAPLTARVRNLAKDLSGDIYATTDVGVFRTSDEGGRWLRMGTGRNDALSLGVDANNKVYLGGYGTVYHLDTGSSEWTLVSMPSGSFTQSICYHEGLLYIATWSRGVQISNDEGKTWIESNDGLGCMQVNVIVSAGNDGLFAATTCGVYVSSDSGRSWQIVPGPLENREVSALVYDQGTLLATTAKFGIFRSRDLGTTWDELYNGLENPNMRSVTMCPNGDVYCGSSYGVQKMSKDGTRWDVANTGLIATYIQCTAIDRNENIYAGTEAGLFRSTDQGTTWNDINYLLTNRNVSCLAVDSTGNLWAGTMNGPVFRSTDAGNSWIDMKIEEIPWAGSIAISSTGTIYAGSGDEIGRVIQSTDNGVTWTIIGQLTSIATLEVLHNDVLFATTWNRGGYRKPDASTPWIISLLSTATGPLAIASNGNILVGEHNSSVIHRSIDNGMTWSSTQKILACQNIYALASDRSGNMLAGTECGAFKSTNDGTLWKREAQPLIDKRVTTLSVATNNNVFAGTGGWGVYRRQTLTGVEVQDQTHASSIASSLKVYPNPSSTDATLAFALSHPARITLTLSTSDGRQIAEPISNEYGIGTHTVSLNTSTLPSGIYVVHIADDANQAVTQPLMVIH